MNQILSLRKLSGIIGWMKPMVFFTSLFFLIYLDGLTTPNQVWTKLESLFGVQDEIRSHQLENELFSLSPSSFSSIEGFFRKSKSLVLLIKKCGIEKKEEKIIISILSKLVLEYSIFVSTIFMLLGLLFLIGKCPLWLHYLIH